MASTIETEAPEQQRPKRPRRRKGKTATVETGVWYPKWYWPSFTAPGNLWLLLMFVLPFYVVICIAFGTVDPIFRQPIPIYQPWWWQFSTFNETLQKFYLSPAIYLPALIRTFEYVIAASLICLVVGYSVAYYTARHAGRYKTLVLILLVSPFWISYLMRIYAWQSLLTPDGYINDFMVLIGFHRVDWLSGQPITVILGLVYGYIPFMILPLFGSLDRINESLLEAGRDLGASPTKTFTRVTLPLSRQAILAGIVIVTLPMFGDYYTNNLLGTAKTAMFGNLIDTAVGQSSQGPAAGSLVLLLMVIVIVPMLYYLRETKRAAEQA